MNSEELDGRFDSGEDISKNCVGFFSAAAFSNLFEFVDTHFS
jgi:hypothetical protein